MNTESLITNGAVLPPKKLDITPCRDINKAWPKISPIHAAQFYKELSIVFIVEFYKILKFCKTQEGNSRKLSRHCFLNLPIHCASFLGNISNIVVSSHRLYFYIYDSTSEKVDTIPRLG